MAGFLKTDNFFEIDKLFHKDKFADPNLFAYLDKALAAWLKQLLEKLGCSEQPVIKGKVSSKAHLEGPVYIDKDAEVEAFAMITGPCYVGPGSEIRHTAYIRGNCYIGAKCVVGHSTEVKSSVFLDGAKAGHFAYVGDSILGREVNLGAGTKLANLKLNKTEIKYKHPATGAIETSGLRKFGAVLGDFAQTGCNTVLDPGTLLLPKTAVLAPSFHGTLTSGIARSK